MAQEENKIRRTRGGFGLWLILSVALLVILAGIGTMALTGRALIVPGWVLVRAEERLNRGIEGQGQVSIGRAEVILDQDWQPRLRLRDMRLTSAKGAPLARFPEVRLGLSREGLLRGQIQPRTLRLAGARVNLLRLPDGRFDLSFADGAQMAPVESLADALKQVDTLFRLPLLAGIERVDAEAMTIVLDDARAGRIWQVTDGRLTLTQSEREIALGVQFGLDGGRGDVARAALTFVSPRNTPEARVTLRVDGVAAADIAEQSAALAWLSVLDAPISGDFRVQVDGAGLLGPIDGRLEIGAGTINPDGNARPIAFSQALMHFAYDPAAARIGFSELSVSGPSLRLSAQGHAYLREMEAGLPEVFLGQVTINELMVDPEGLFAAPVRFSQGALDLRLRLDPLTLEIGQAVLIEGDHRLEASGAISAAEAGWDVALDVAVDQIGHERLLALWPYGVVPRTRDWLTQNLQTGTLFNVRAAVRMQPQQQPRLSLVYEFRDADVRFIKTLPPIEGGAGYATIFDSTHTIMVREGHVTAPMGGTVDVAGTVFQVPDITVKPPPGTVFLRSRGPVTAILSLLDEPPFQFLSKAGQRVDLAEGQAELEARIDLILRPKVPVEEVDYSVTARLSDLRSEVIVPGRVLVAPQLALHATRAGIEITGPGTLDGVPFDVTWSQGFAPEQKGKSRVTGWMELSPALSEALSLAIPAGMVSGATRAQIAVDLEKGMPPRFMLTSDLAGLGLDLPMAGWALAPQTRATFELGGTLGAEPQIGHLLLKAPGLSVSGGDLRASEGRFEALKLSRVTLGDWFDAPVELRGQGAGNPVHLAITGGTVDLRKRPQAVAGGGGGGGAGNGASQPVSVALDWLTLSDKLALTGVQGNFGTRGGFNGQFSGRVNGDALVTGVIVPYEGRSAVRLRADDVGAVLRSAGLTGMARDGVMDLVLYPRDARGDYDGHLTIRNIRVKDAPILADLLGAISVIGLIEQLRGDGIVFSEVEADFRLTPEALELKQASAIGPSLGVSLEGLYGMQTRTFDMQGVVSPVYMVNSIGSILTRRGEGLFGFNFALKGAVDNPKVSVNPLSILTPGMFRDLFRRDPPKLEQ